MTDTEARVHAVRSLAPFRTPTNQNDARLGSALADIAQRGEELEPHDREDLQAHEIASLYARTISNLSPRIIVNGKPEYLQRERTTDWISTLLLAGIRSATLWSQLGGGRFELMFGRKKIRKDAETFLAG